jgi:putative toxin-antitoxin system antitoxin component (TIGR02293 family)
MPIRRKASSAGLQQFFYDWLGTAAGSEQHLASLVEAGLPLQTITNLLAQGLSKDEVFSLVINPRTLKHRKSRRQALSKEESERAVRAARVLARAEAVLGSRQAALDWMRRPKRRFEGRSPLQMLATEPGGRLVEEMLIQVDEGMFA